MGYDSNFQLSILRCKDEDEGHTIIQEIEKESGYTFENESSDSAELHEAHWYDAVSDIASVARRHPEAVIQLFRDGEDKDDTEITRFRGDERETLQPQVIWPPFETIILPEDENAGGGS